MSLPKTLSRIALAAVICAQMAVPVWMIATNETTLARGTEYRLRVEPLDPYDPFRGRYVTVSPVDTLVSAYPDFPNDAATCYITFSREEGYDVPAWAYTHIPYGEEYLEVSVEEVFQEEGEILVRIVYPFDRVFLNEEVAPRVESLFRDYEGIVTLSVFVKDGMATVRTILFDGKEAVAIR